MGKLVATSRHPTMIRIMNHEEDQRRPLTLLLSGLGIIVCLEILLFAAVRGLPAGSVAAAAGRLVRVHMTPWAWTAWLAVLCGVLGLLDRSFRPARWRYRLVLCWLWSVPVWCYFDWLNFFFMRNPATGLHAWEYQGMPANPGDRFLGYLLAFGAIAPAMFLTAEIWMRLGLYKLKTAGVRIGGPVRVLCGAAGVAFFLAPFFIRRPVANLMIWMSLIFLLDPINYYFGRPSIIGDLIAVPQPIAIKIFSDDAHVLNRQARKVALALKNISGVVEVHSGIVVAGDALEVHVDRVKAALQEMSAGSITRALNDYLSGVVTTRIEQGIMMIGVRVWVPQDRRATRHDLRNILLRAPDGHLFALKDVATITTLPGQQEIDRDNLKRMIAVTGRIEGRDMGSTLTDVQTMLNHHGMFPRGVYYQLGGLYHQQQVAFQGLLVVLIAAVLLVFLVLLFLYEQFRVAAAMMSIPLLALCCVFVGLWLTHTELNVSSMMGMTMVVGIVTEVSIFYYSEFQELPDTLPVTERLVLAGKNRMRPIAMTTFAAILALLPLALGIGQGSGMQQPLAVAIIAGLAAQLPLVLVVLPLMLNALARRAGR